MVYAGLPPELWDQHLWMYGSLLPLLSHEMDDAADGVVGLYTAPTGVAMATGMSGDSVLDIAATDEGTALVLAAEARADGRAPRRMCAADDAIAAALRDRLAPDAAASAVCRLWTREPAPPLPAAVGATRELQAADAARFRGIRFPDGRVGWPGFPACLRAGRRYFGLFLGERLAAVAGLERLTRFRSEIIGVCTYRPEDRRRGLARQVCGLAMEAALETTPVVTWTADAANAASLATARGLGMRPYQTIYTIVPLADPVTAAPMGRG